MNATIFYFTGTGNSLKVAKDIAAILPDAELVQISKKNMPGTGTVYSGTVGIVFPVYYFGLPHMVRAFARGLQVEKNTYVFGIATYGGMVGVAFNQLGKCLAKKGITLSAAFAVHMPGNCQVLYAPEADTAQQEKFRNERETTAGIARRINAREEILFKPPNIIARGIMGIFYSRLKPHKRSRKFHTDEKCTGCGTCARICPAQNITLQDKKPRWHNQCEFCLACMQWCPNHAIQYGNKTQKRGRYHHPEIKVHELFQD